MSPIRRTGLLVALCISLLVVVLLNLRFVEARRSADRRIGVRLDATEQGLALALVEHGTPAERGGLRPGDVLISVAGQKVSGNDDYDAVASSFKRGGAVTFEVRRDGGPVSLAITPGMDLAWTPLVAGSVVVLGYLLLALLTTAQPQRELRATLLFLFSAAVALELALPSDSVGSADIARWSNAAFFILTGLEVGLELHLVSLIPERRSWLSRRPWLVPGYYLAGIGAGAVLCVTYLAHTFGAQPFPWNYGDALAALNSVLIPLWALAVSGLLTYQVITSTEPLGRQQAALVLTGEIPWAFLMVATAVLELAGKTTPAWVELIEPPVLLCFPVAVFVAIFRFHLFDIELAVRRGMVYTTLTGTLVLVFYAAMGAGGALFSQWVGGRISVVVVSGATLLLGLLFSPLRNVLQRLIDRRVFPERHAQRQRLAALAAELPAFGKVPLMGKHLVNELRQIFAAESATLLVAEPERRLLVTVAATKVNPERDFDQSFLLSPDDPGVQFLQKGRRPLPVPQVAGRSASLAQRLQFFQAAVVVPVMSGDELIGLLLLGDKRGGVAYLREEMELLSLVSHHVATMFENARLFESATTDSLTGLLRRETVLGHLERELRRAGRYRRTLAVGMADLDHFKVINDRHGHLVGDTVLKRAAQELSAGLRSADLIGRYGGEEFLFVLPETDLEGARVVAEKIRRGVESIRLRTDDGGVLAISVSIGLATLSQMPEQDEVSVQAMIAAADRNLLRAKAAGRNRIEP
ncbi:MAG: diguanylate cyclase [Acidobacteriota bacterium]